MQQHTFVLKLTDQPGGLATIAATFAHRGISLDAALGNSDELDPDGRATVLVSFKATEARKEVMRRTLSRLTRVRSVTEYAPDAPNLRTAAVVRLRAGSPAPAFAEDVRGWIDHIQQDKNTGESIWLIAGHPLNVNRLVRFLHQQDQLLAVTHTIIAA